MLPIFSYGQLWEYEQDYFSLSTEADVANLAGWGDDINGYNGVINLDYRNGHMQMGISYETFPNRQFKSYGAGGSYVMNPEGRFNLLVGIKASLIWREVPNLNRGHDPSVAFNVQPEYHISNTFYVYIRNEVRYRGDLKAMYDGDVNTIVNSVFAGLGIKLF